MTGPLASAQEPQPQRDRVEIGLGIQSDKPPGSYARIARLAESFDIDVVSVFSDLLFQPPIVALLEMAGATTQVRLGAACWNPFTLHPYEIAGQLAALDAASDGRAYLGLAKGTWLDAVGIEQSRPVAQLRDAAGHIYALLSGEGNGYDGEFFALKPGVALRYPVLRARPPLLLGSWGPLGAALAGRIADELKVGGTTNPAMVAVMRDRIAVGAAQLGRSASDVKLVIGAVTVVDRDGAKARAVARREVAMYLAAVADLDPTIELPGDLIEEVRQRADAGDHVGAGERIPDDVLDLFAFSGTPEQVARQAQQLIDAGADRIDFGTPHGLDDLGGIELIGREVLPLLARDR